MADLISREAAIEAIYNSMRYGEGYKAICTRAIERIPAVNAAPVMHGRWDEIEDIWGDCHYQCTECGIEWNLDAGTPAENNMNYCPNCGAKMDGELRETK